MTERAESTERERPFIRSMHPYAYKSGEWGQIVGYRERESRRVWMIVWPDGATDEWAVHDPVGNYEFSETGT